MKLLSRGPLRLLALFTLIVSLQPSVFASNDTDERDVRICYVQGDVLLSRGRDSRLDLKKTWEQAQGDELLEQGFALATGSGRAEIAFENGSMAFLAENSLLLFTELSAKNDRVVTRMTLASGTATFSLQPAVYESFFLKTPTDTFQVSAPKTFFARIDAYLDATGLTPQDEDGEKLIRRGQPDFKAAKGQTVFIQAGELLPVQEPTPSKGYRIRDGTHERNDRPTFLLLKFSSAQEAVSALSESGSAEPSAAYSSLVASDWDNWVSGQVQRHRTLMAAALKASGLSSVTPGLADMYEHGSFFQCEPYGTCWEQTQLESASESHPQSRTPDAQLPPIPTHPSGTFPQTVQWQEPWSRFCGTWRWRTVSLVPHTPSELQEILRQKDLAEQFPLRDFVGSDACRGFWISHRGHFAKLVLPPVPPKCKGKTCAPVHPVRPRRPLWVRAGDKVGFVPRHPLDVHGHPPLNLKYGLFIPPSKSNPSMELVALKPSEKITVLDKTPNQFRNEISERVMAVPAPEIHAHLVREAFSPAHQSSLKISYDYKTQRFMMAEPAGRGEKSK